MLFVLPQVIDALAHGAATRRPANISKSAATREAVKLVMAYVGAAAHGSR
jgi:hypothetical protein